MTEAQDSRDVERAQVHNLAAAAAKLLERAAAAPVGRTALTLLPGAGAPLKQTLLALRGGVHLAERDGPGGSDAAGPAGPGAVGDERGELGAGSGRPPADPAHPAPAGECGGRCRPVDRGHETIQVRETPGNLSGSGSEIHQNFRQLMLIAACRCHLIQMLW